MSVFNDIAWTKKGNTETCLHIAEEVAAFWYKIQARAQVLLGERVRKDALEWKHQRNPRTLVFSFPPNTSSDRTKIAWTVEERRNK